MLWHQLTRGAEGGMVALPMIDPQGASHIWTAFSNGDLESAYDEYKLVTAFIHCALGFPDYVTVIKAVLHARGVIASPEVRLPHIAPTQQRLSEVLNAL